MKTPKHPKHRPLRDLCIKHGQLRPWCLPTNIVKGPSRVDESTGEAVDGNWHIVPDFVKA